MVDKTGIAIAHRLSSVIGMDRIVVLQEGLIKEEGSHDERVRHYSLWKQRARL